MDGVIDYRALGSPEALAAELRRLSEDDAAYARMFEWQKHPERWAREFLDIQAQAAEGVHTQCRLCQVPPPYKLYPFSLPCCTSGKVFSGEGTPRGVHKLCHLCQVHSPPPLLPTSTLSPFKT